MARIIDMTSEVGAYAGRLMAEMGHDVVRIEPRGGDALRRLAPRLAGLPETEAGAFHQFLNAGKRSFTPDLATEDGRSVLCRLIARADMVLASIPAAISDDEILAANPAAVLVRLDDGPPELCAYARSGLMAITGDPDGPPLLMGGHIPHAAIGTYAAIAAASALLVKDATGRGQVVDVSAAQCLAVLCEQPMIEYVTRGEVMGRRGARGGITAVAGALPCADGHWMICVPPTEDGWGNFARMVGDPALIADRSLAQEGARREKRDEILDSVAAWSAGSPRDELVNEAQRRHIPASPVTTPRDLVDDPQLLARGFLRELAHPMLGTLNAPVGAIGQLWDRPPAAAPRLGEHNAAILAELGYAADERRRLMERACA